MTARSTYPKTYFRNQHDAAAGIDAIVRDKNATLAAGDFLVLGSTGEFATATNAALTPGTLRTFQTYAIRNLVVTHLGEPDNTDYISVSNSLAGALTGSDAALVTPRAPRYTAPSENQRVVYNDNVVAVDVSLTWEETALPGFLGGGHPGTGAVTIPLGSIDPTAFDISTAPIRFRFNMGRKVRIDGVAVFSRTPIVVTAGTATLDARINDVSINLAGVPATLHTLTPDTLTPVDLVASATARTAVATANFDLLVALSAFLGSAGDVTVEVSYTIL